MEEHRIPQDWFSAWCVDQHTPSLGRYCPRPARNPLGTPAASKAREITFQSPGASDGIRSPLCWSRRMYASSVLNLNAAGIRTVSLLPLIKTLAFSTCAMRLPFFRYRATYLRRFQGFARPMASEDDLGRVHDSLSVNSSTKNRMPTCRRRPTHAPPYQVPRRQSPQLRLDRPSPRFPQIGRVQPSYCANEKSWPRSRGLAKISGINISVHPASSAVGK
jgi:hypothetical protein